MGTELAHFLVEFLPFEESSRAMMSSVQLILQAELISTKTRADIWQRAKRRNAFYLGFIRQGTQALPAEQPCHPEYELCQQLLAQQDDPCLQILHTMFSSAGQTLLEIIGIVLRKPNDQDVAVELFNSIGDTFNSELALPRHWRSIEELIECVEKTIQAERFSSIIRQWPPAYAYIYAILYLAMLSETLLDPIFGVTDSIGSVMRKRIKHLTDPILEQLSAIT